MGLDPVSLGVMAAVATIGGAANKIGSARAEQDQINLREKQQQIQYNQKTLNNYDVMEKTIKAQQAALSTTGTVGGASFDALQRDIFNKGAKEQQTLDTELSIGKDLLSLERRNVKSKLYADLFGITTNFLMSQGMMQSKIPTSVGK